MPSPFPGMNPYLERATVWHDFHTRYVTAVAEAVGGLVEPRYFVSIEEHVYLHELPDGSRERVGDADVSVHPAGDPAAAAAAGRVAAPAFVYLAPDVERVRYLAVQDREGADAVTVIELLSRSNKYAGPDRDQYVGKRATLLATATNFVELDLLRGGPRMPWVGLAGGDYYAVVSRPADRPRADVWPVRLRDPLPSIPIPLRPGEPEPLLDLQAALHRVYDASRYRLRIYRGDPEPRLAAEDAAWARALVTPTAP